MPARNPEDVGRLIVEAINSGDLKAALAMYEPEAASPDEQGEVSSGIDSRHRSMASVIAMKPDLNVEVEKVILAGDIALVYSRWSMSKPDPASGRTVGVARRQSDGTWRFVIDDPMTLSA